MIYSEEKFVVKASPEKSTSQEDSSITPPQHASNDEPMQSEKKDDEHTDLHRMFS